MIAGSCRRVNGKCAPEGDRPMKLTLQVEKGVLSAFPGPLDQTATQTPSARSADSTGIEAAPPTPADPACDYGCVDWYLYPELKREHAAA